MRSLFQNPHSAQLPTKINPEHHRDAKKTEKRECLFLPRNTSNAAKIRMVEPDLVCKICDVGCHLNVLPLSRSRVLLRRSLRSPRPSLDLALHTLQLLMHPHELVAPLVTRRLLGVRNLAVQLLISLIVALELLRQLNGLAVAELQWGGTSCCRTVEMRRCSARRLLCRWCSFCGPWSSSRRGYGCGRSQRSRCLQRLCA